MVAVAVVQSAIDQIIQVIAMRHGGVSATVMPAPAICRRAICRVGRADFYDMFVVMIAVQRMQMAIVQIIGMVAVQHGQVSAIRTVNVGMIGM